MKQGEAYSEAFFDLAIQNMLKRTKFIKTSGETGDATEHWVKKRGYDTKMLKDVAIPLDVLFLSNVAGSGNLPSLHQAMAMDEMSVA